MKTPVKSLGLLCSAALWLATGPVHAQFQQITAGAVSLAENSKLVFANGASFDVSSGYAHPLVYTVVTNFVLTNVIYSATNLQFWSLSNTNPGAAAIGSYIVCEVLSVTGPAGGVFSFWEQGWRTPTFSFPVGVTPVASSNRFDVSEIGLGAGLGDGDPIGRIPLRRFTVNQPGDYFVTFKLFDTSTNTASWGPAHTPSDPITVKFSTGFDLGITRFIRSAANSNAYTLTFKQSALTNVLVEANTNLTLDTWMTVAGPFTSAPALNNATTLSITNPELASRFYRLRGVSP
ncbi:MAG TPA: hypothetical protein VK846_15385 [Candidatus Limnocylindria bacterium]|nr:hypothetical protein [Candidatus Limnocylindria bacterium]